MNSGVGSKTIATNRSQIQFVVITHLTIDQKPLTSQARSNLNQKIRIKRKKKVKSKSQRHTICQRHLPLPNYFNCRDLRMKQTAHQQMTIYKLKTSTKIHSITKLKYGIINTTNSSRRRQLWSWFHSLFRRTRSWSGWPTWRTTSMDWLPSPTSLTSMRGLESSSWRPTNTTWWLTRPLSFCKVLDSISQRWTWLAQ
jgi:hypothetical protein